MKLEKFNVNLSEGKLEDLKAVYVGEGPNKISEHVFNRLVSIDAAVANNPNKKYLQWMCKRMSEEHDHQNLVRLQHLIPAFEDLIKRNQLQGADKDINSYKKIENLFDKTNKVKENPEETDSIKKFKELAIINGELILDNGKCLIVKPKTKESSIIYGSGTTWCTSAGVAFNYFNNYYNNQGVSLYYILVKLKDVPKNWKKIAFAQYPKLIKGTALSQPRWEVFDSQDKHIPENEYIPFLDSLGAYDKCPCGTGPGSQKVFLPSNPKLSANFCTSCRKKWEATPKEFEHLFK